MTFLIILGIIGIGSVTYLAISKKSGKIVRMSALFALGLMILAVIICLFVLFGSGSEVPTPFFEEDLIPQEPAPGISGPVLIILIIFILALFILVLFLALRDRSKLKKKIIADTDW